MYTPFKNALETLIKTSLNTVKTIDWYNNQYGRYEDLKAIKLPACYIEFENPMRWKTNGDGLQTADAVIKLHLVHFDVADSPVASLKLTNELHKAIHGKRLMEVPVLMNELLTEDGAALAIEGKKEQLSTELMRTQSEMVQDYDQLKVTILTYACTLYDLTMLKRYAEVTPSFVLKVK